MSFKYETDITLTINNVEWTISSLLGMNDENFQKIYKQYEFDIYNLINENNTSPTAKLGAIAISSTIGIMERVKLERRIQKLEQNNK